ncbi:serpin family protein [bacterium]|nr:serpin family protein [bacterium]
MDNRTLLHIKRYVHSKLFQLVSIISLVILASCSSTDDPVYTPPRALTAGEQQIVSSDNTFGLKIFKDVSSEEGDKNVVISPLSISMALGMTVNGAAGATRDSMLRTLELQGIPMDDINQSYKTLIDYLANLDPNVKFDLANSIWYRNTYHFEQSFFDVCKEHFNAEIAGLNFGDPAGSKATINNWVNEKTNGKIKEIIEDIDDASMMFLINAIYFKGAWHKPFDAKKTIDGTFYKINGERETCKMMNQTEFLSHGANEYFKIVDLPYSNGNYSMTIFLPQEDKTLNECINAFTQENYNEWIGRLSHDTLELSMPKFTVEYKIKLNDALKRLGMGLAFDRDYADFTNMDNLGGHNLSIDEVMHKTFLLVDEEGAEAAAATSVEMINTSMPHRIIMNIDHPFLFVIRDTQAGTIIFIGKILEI